MAKKIKGLKQCVKVQRETTKTMMIRWGTETKAEVKTKKEKSKMKYFAFLMINCIFLSSATTK